MTLSDSPPAPSLEERVFALERPDPRLWTYYLLTSLAAGPFFVFPLLYYTFRYRTLRYRFDDEGISMRWGVLFRREIHLTYARIQDIHLSSDFVERWLGLGRIEIQTASGSAKAEMTIQGVRESEELRDFLYSRMRGVRPESTGRLVPAQWPGAPERARRAAGGPAAVPADGSEELAAVLREVAAELRAVRRELEGRSAREGAERD